MCEDDDSAWRAATATATTTTSPAAAAAAAAAAASSAGAAALRRVASCVSPQDKLRQLRAALDTLTDGDQVDADGLVERVVEALRCPQPPPTATPPSPAAVDVAAAMTETTLWHAECTFIENTLRAGDWSVGAESYALTTLLQVLYSAVLWCASRACSCHSVSSHPCCVLYSRHCMRLEPYTPRPEAASAAVRRTT